MPDPWPWPGEDALTRARRVAREYRAELRKADPGACAKTDDLAARFGETWVAGVEVSGDDVLTTSETATWLEITPRAVRLAVQRGRLTAAGQDDDGYLFHRADVIKYLGTRRRRAVAQRHGSPVPS